MFLDVEDFSSFFMLSTLILLTIFFFLWILWTASLYCSDINNDNESDIDTDQEEITVYTIESQF